MTNYFCQFSTVVEALRDALDWLEAKLKKAERPDNETDYGEDEFPCRIERRAPGLLYLVGDGDGDIDIIVDAVCEMQRIFKLADPWAITFAEVCPDEGLYGGTAVICHKGKSNSFSISELVSMEMRELAASGRSDTFEGKE